MKKIFSTILLILTFSLDALAQTEYSLSLYDSSRERVIPVTVYSPKKVNRHTGVVVFSHGYDKNKDPQSNQRYAYLNRYLAENGYYVVSIQHEHPDDPQMPLTGGNFAVTRRSNWERGKENVMFTINAFKALKPDLDWKKLILIGHSNGGDISMLCIDENPQLFYKGITLDSRRMRMPRTYSPRLYTLRGCDYEADEGVLPTEEEQKQYRMTVVKLDGINHRDFGRRGTHEQHDIIKQRVYEFVKE